MLEILDLELVKTTVSGCVLSCASFFGAFHAAQSYAEISKVAIVRKEPLVHVDILSSGHYLPFAMPANSKMLVRRHVDVYFLHPRSLAWNELFFGSVLMCRGITVAELSAAVTVEIRITGQHKMCKTQAG
jgi:hypothetical protein